MDELIPNLPQTPMVHDIPRRISHEYPPDATFMIQSTPYVPPVNTYVPPVSACVPPVTTVPPVIQTPMIPITLPKFTGYAHDDGEKFISDFTAAMTLQGITSDVPKISALSLYLSGPAFLWFETLPPSFKTSWPLLLGAFRDKYVSFNLSTNGSLIAEMEAFNTLKLGKSTVEDFYFNILKLGKKLKKSQLDLMTKFIDGLPDQLKFFVRAGRPTNIDDALQSARIGESVGYGTSHRVSDHAEVSHQIQCNASYRPAHDLQGQVDSLAAQVMSLTSMLRQADSPSQSCGGADNRDVCFKCQGPGHRRNVCKWNGSKSSQPATQCQLCEQFGHLATDCVLHSPVNEKGSGANGRGQLKKGK